MPVLNEADYVEMAVASVLSQDYPGPTEIVLALAPSTDGTDEVIARLREHDARIRVVDNPGADIPIGMNRAIAASRHPVIVRVDAHTQLSPGYTERGVQTLLREQAANVGGIMAAVGRPGVQAAVAQAYNSRLGLGGGAYHSLDVAAGPAESAYLGVMRADALAEIGGYDESLRRGEDWELNYRLRQAGHRVWLDPALRVTYWPRDSWRALVRQFFATGVWRGELVRRLRAGNSPRFFAPPTLVIATLLSLVLVPLAAVGVLGWAAWVAAVIAVVPAAYLLFLLVAAATAHGGPAARGRFVLALAIMHFAWGTGLLRGVAHGGGNAVDTSRAT
jgi:glycosyltransferase involved in cell wall biosynthesis